MSDKIVHLTHEAHAAMRVYCLANQLFAREWVSRLILVAVQPTASAFTKKSLVVLDDKSLDEPWDRPPFWTGRPK